MPNMGTDFVIIAFSLLALERFNAWRDRERRRPQIEPILGEIGSGLVGLAAAMVRNYAQTHPHAYVRPPNRIIDLVPYWQAGLDSAYAGWPPAVDTTEIVINSATGFAQTLEEHESRYGRVLDDPALSAAMIRFAQASRAAAMFNAITGRLTADREQREQAAREYLGYLGPPSARLAQQYERVAALYGVTEHVRVSDSDFEEMEAVWVRRE